MASRYALTSAPSSRAAHVCESCVQRMTARLFSACAPATRKSSNHRRKPASVNRARFHTVARPIITESSTRTHRSSRGFATAAASLPTSPSPAGLTHLPSQRLIRLRGADTPKFLQGLVTSNVDSSSTSPFYSAFLDARGRVLADVFIWPVTWSSVSGPESDGRDSTWSCLVEVDGTELDGLSRYLKRHRLRSKVQIEVVGQEEMSVWAAWGESSRGIEAQTGDERSGDGGKILSALEDPRAEGFGTRLLCLANDAPAQIQQGFSLPLLDVQQYQLRRYLHGIAEGPVEISRELSLPMEVNIDLARGIDFRKGCYVGQELTIRTKHTGVVRKRMLPVQLYTSDQEMDAVGREAPLFGSGAFASGSGAATPAAGTDIKGLDAQGSIKKGRAAGKFVTGMGNVGLALCRLEMMTDMEVAGGAESGVDRGGNKEFGMLVNVGDEHAERVVRVKAFAPEWLRRREKEVWGKAKAPVQR